MTKQITILGVPLSFYSNRRSGDGKKVINFINRSMERSMAVIEIIKALIGNRCIGTSVDSTTGGSYRVYTNFQSVKEIQKRLRSERIII